jgi:hypothetical protein
MHLIETHVNIPRRVYDSQFSLTRTPLECEQAHQRVLALYNTTAHQGLLEEQWPSPSPLDVLGAAKGRLDPPDALARKFAHALWPRTTNRSGGVTWHSYHFYVELRHEVARVIVWRVVRPRPVVPSTVSYEVRQQGHALSKALRQGTHSLWPGTCTAKGRCLGQQQAETRLAGRSGEHRGTRAQRREARQAKEAARLGPKGIGVGPGLFASPVMDTHHSRRTESPSPVRGTRAQRGQPVSLRPVGREDSRQGNPWRCG